MKKVYQAIDGLILDKKSWCEEYEALLSKAEKAVEQVNFRVIELGWNLDPKPIKQHDPEIIWKAWYNFLEVVKELIVWSGSYTEYSQHPGAEPRDIENDLLEQLTRYQNEHLNIYPVALWNEWPGFWDIRRKFEAINFENGEEYVGSFGAKGSEGRKSFLDYINESKEMEDNE